MDPTLQLAVMMSLVDNVTGPLGGVREELEGLEAMAERGRGWAAMGQQMQIAGVLSQQTGEQMLGMLQGPVNAAVELESVMADVNKVLDLDPAALAALTAEIQAMSGTMAVSAVDLAAIVEAAGQAGIPQDQLMGFARQAAEMAVAFDIGADEAGAAMANWRAGMGLTQEDVAALADTVNYLSNNMNATAADLTTVIQRQGATAMAAGLAEQEVAALGAALLSGGAAPEIAATAMKNFTGALTDGEAATRSQRDALSQLGFDAEQMAVMMQEDAAGAITQVLEALAAQPAHARGSLASMLFGEESRGAIMPLLANTENLTQAFALASDAGSSAGSMQAEFASRSDTAENAMARLENNVTALQVAIGDSLLPTMVAATEEMITWAQWAGDFAEANPELTEAVVLMGGLGAVSLLALAPILQVGGAIITAGGWALQGAAWVGRMAASMRLAAMGSWLFSAALWASPITWMVAGVAALAAAAYLIYEYWDPITEWFGAVWGHIQAAFDDGFVNGILYVLQEFNPVTWIARGINELIEWIFGVDLFAVGAEWFGGLSDGIAEAWAGLVAWLNDAIMGLVSWMPAWVQEQLGIDIQGRVLLSDADIERQAQASADEARDSTLRSRGSRRDLSPADIEAEREAAAERAYTAERERLLAEREALMAEQESRLAQAAPEAAALAAVERERDMAALAAAQEQAQAAADNAAPVIVAQTDTATALAAPPAPGGDDGPAAPPAPDLAAPAMPGLFTDFMAMDVPTPGGGGLPDGAMADFGDFDAAAARLWDGAGAAQAQHAALAAESQRVITETGGMTAGHQGLLTMFGGDFENVDDLIRRAGGRPASSADSPANAPAANAPAANGPPVLNLTVSPSIDMSGSIIDGEVPDALAYRLGERLAPIIREELSLYWGDRAENAHG